MNRTVSPRLVRIEREGLAVWTDERLREEHGVLVAFSERSGGVSRPPFDTLDLAAHVGDDPAAVDENRSRLLAVLGLGSWRHRLVTAEQVHGERVAVVGEDDAGAGAFASGGLEPLPGTDALVTCAPGLPLMLLYADCVPVVLVAPGDRACVAVVHAGWRGVLARLPGKTALRLAEIAGMEPSSLLAYIGPHIGECCYEVDPGLLSQFGLEFATVDRACARLDLAAAVHESLTDVGVSSAARTAVDRCTRHHTDMFFSYRAEKRTGRHAAVAAIVKSNR